MSRRSLLSKAGAAAVAAVAAGTLLNTREAKADHYGGNPEYDSIKTHYLLARNGGAGSFAVRGETNSRSYAAVEGINYGTNSGIYGSSRATGSSGVHGSAFNSEGGGFGVEGEGKGSGYAGVLGHNRDGTGVWDQSEATGYSGVYGQHTGTGGGYGVVGDGKGTGAGVLGRNRNTGGAGVRGEGHTGVWGTSDITTGVVGQHTGSEGRTM